MQSSECFVNEAAVVIIKGELDNDAWPNFLPIIQKILIGDTRLMLLNLQAVTTMDDAGLSLIQLTDSILKSRNGSLVLTQPNEHLREQLAQENLPIIDLP